MPNTFGTDILIQTPDLNAAEDFYVEQLSFAVTMRAPNMLGLAGPNINLYIEQGPPLGTVLEISVPDVAIATAQLVASGATILKHEPEVPRTYIRDPFGLVYNLKRI